MATEVITRILCDVCAANETTTEGERYTVAFNGHAREMDACAEHAAPILAVLATVEAYGRKPSGLAPTAPAPRQPDQRHAYDPQVCALCGRTYRNVASLMSHGASEHGMRAAEFRAASGGRRPPAATLICEDCGKAFRAANGLASHRRMHERERAAAARQTTRAT